MLSTPALATKGRVRALRPKMRPCCPRVSPPEHALLAITPNFRKNHPFGGCAALTLPYRVSCYCVGRVLENVPGGLHSRETFDEKPDRPVGPLRAVLLPDPPRFDRRPDRQQAADDVRDDHETRRGSLLEFSSPDAAGPY